MGLFSRTPVGRAYVTLAQCSINATSGLLTRS
jgi:hypothetical protein